LDRAVGAREGCVMLVVLAGLAVSLVVVLSAVACRRSARSTQQTELETADAEREHLSSWGDPPLMMR
jgi:hypothetical protein